MRLWNRGVSLRVNRMLPRARSKVLTPEEQRARVQAMEKTLVREERRITARRRRGEPPVRRLGEVEIGPVEVSEDRDVVTEGNATAQLHLGFFKATAGPEVIVVPEALELDVRPPSLNQVSRFTSEVVSHSALHLGVADPPNEATAGVEVGTHVFQAGVRREVPPGSLILGVEQGAVGQRCRTISGPAGGCQQRYGVPLIEDETTVQATHPVVPVGVQRPVGIDHPQVRARAQVTPDAEQVDDRLRKRVGIVGIDDVVHGTQVAHVEAAHLPGDLGSTDRDSRWTACRRAGGAG